MNNSNELLQAATELLKYPPVVLLMCITVSVLLNAILRRVAMRK